MKKVSLLLCIVPLFMAFNVTSGMAEIDGAMLLDNCKEAIKYFENNKDPSINFSAVNYCVGYISGINDLHASFVSSVSCFDPPKYCAPQPADSKQLVEIIVRFLTDHPEDLQFHGSDIILVALKEAFPCPQNTHD